MNHCGLINFLAGLECVAARATARYAKGQIAIVPTLYLYGENLDSAIENEAEGSRETLLVCRHVALLNGLNEWFECACTCTCCIA
ncbi:hypothetical protein [Microcoleus sp. SVA1B1]|uniref:hypothetical protein n=1 Tax=Microcoleus sp. SVA1B1 TaxID=3055422 RepID=UPI002FD186AF